MGQAPASPPYGARANSPAGNGGRRQSVSGRLQYRQSVAQSAYSGSEFSFTIGSLKLKSTLMSFSPADKTVRAVRLSGQCGLGHPARSRTDARLSPTRSNLLLLNTFRSTGASSSGPNGQVSPMLHFAFPAMNRLPEQSSVGFRQAAVQAVQRAVGVFDRQLLVHDSLLVPALPSSPYITTVLLQARDGQRGQDHARRQSGNKPALLATVKSVTGQALSPTSGNGAAGR